MNGDPKVIILGAGPAGLGAALGLAQRGLTPVLIEREGRVGGNAGSFGLGGMRVDFGSHRLHPSTDPAILASIRSLLGPDLLERARHGRIHLGGRLIHFPLRPLDLALRAPPSFLMGAALDLVKRLRSRKLQDGPESFESLLLRGLGPTVCEEFYFPYARKIWGLEPSQISPVQAEKRVSAKSTGRLLRRLLPGSPGKGGQRGRGIFFYPRNGFGQISDAIWEEAGAKGAKTLLDTTVRRVSIQNGGFSLELDGGEAGETAGRNGSHSRILHCDQVWSTIPLPTLSRIIEPAPPAEVLASANQLRSRAMLLVYLVLDEDRFSEFDAHYFPSAHLPFTRVSEPKNYAGLEDPGGRTVLCAEIPCSTEDSIWTLEESALVDVVRDGLDQAGLPVRSAIVETAIRRLPSAYPIYERGYEANFQRVLNWLEELRGIISFGRQGLFAHDNTHHALLMARSAVHCLGENGHFDQSRWSSFKEIFATHVVED